MECSVIWLDVGCDVGDELELEVVEVDEGDVLDFVLVDVIEDYVLLWRVYVLFCRRIGDDARRERRATDVVPKPVVVEVCVEV